jgi:hypothetical protein
MMLASFSAFCNVGSWVCDYSCDSRQNKRTGGSLMATFAITVAAIMIVAMLAYAVKEFGDSATLHKH